MGAPGPQLGSPRPSAGLWTSYWHWGPVRWGRTTGTSAFWCGGACSSGCAPENLRAAVTAETARWVDGLLTVGHAGPRRPFSSSRGLRQGRGAGKPVILQVALAYAEIRSIAQNPMSSGGSVVPSEISPNCGRRSSSRPSPAMCVPKTWTPPCISADPQ